MAHTQHSTKHLRGSQWMHGFYLLNLASLLYFSGWMESTCCPVKFRMWEVFWHFFFLVLLLLYIQLCFSVSNFPVLCASTRSFSYTFLFKVLKGLSSTWLALSLSARAVLIENREEIALKHFFLECAHTISQEEIVVGDMLRRNDIIFRPNAAKCRLAEWQPVKTALPNG